MAISGTWRPSRNLVYARSVAAANVASRQPGGFAGGGPVAKVQNRGATDVLITFYSFATLSADPTTAFPVDGSPPVGTGGGNSQVSALVPAGGTVFVDGVGQSDSFTAIGAAAGPSLIYVQRGEGGDG